MNLFKKINWQGILLKKVKYEEDVEHIKKKYHVYIIARRKQNEYANDETTANADGTAQRKRPTRNEKNNNYIQITLTRIKQL